MNKPTSSHSVLWLGAAFFLVAFAAAGLRAEAPQVKAVTQIVASNEKAAAPTRTDAVAVSESVIKVSDASAVVTPFSPVTDF